MSLAIVVAARGLEPIRLAGVSYDQRMKKFLHARAPKEIADSVAGGMKIERDHLDHLVEQLEFMDASCEAYDSGSRSEAKRLATTVRVLVHDTRASKSLLGQIGVKDKVPWADGIIPAILKNLIEEQEKGNLGSASLLTMVKLGAGFLENYELIKVVPVFDVHPLGDRWVPFDYWWTTARLVDTNEQPISRKQIVLFLANKSGGAHVDDLPDSWRFITRENGMGFNLSRLEGKTKADDSPVPAAMRQIAEEVRFTIREKLGELIAIKHHLDEIEP